MSQKNESSFNLEQFNRFTPETISPEVAQIAREAFTYWQVYVKQVGPDLDVPEIEIQEYLSPFDYKANTYERIYDLLAHIWTALSIDPKRQASSILEIKDYSEWEEILNNYSNPHHPVFGVLEDQLLVYDARNQLKIAVYGAPIVEDEVNKDDLMFYKIVDQYRLLGQEVTVSSKEEDKRLRIALSAYKYQQGLEGYALPEARMFVERYVEV